MRFYRVTVSGDGNVCKYVPGRGVICTPNVALDVVLVVRAYSAEYAITRVLARGWRVNADGMPKIGRLSEQGDWGASIDNATLKARPCRAKNPVDFSLG